MVRRLSPHSSGQLALLTPALGGGELVRDLSSPIPLHEVNYAPRTDVIERAKHLDAALGHLGQISQRTGLQMAAEGSHRPELQERYGGKVDRVVAGATRRKEEMLIKSKWEFARAFGQFTLANS